jgi:hypothetical protein
MFDKNMEIFRGIDLHIYSREDNPELYVIEIVNRKLERKRIINFHANIGQVAEVVGYLHNMRNKLFNLKYPKKK